MLIKIVFIAVIVLLMVGMVHLAREGRRRWAVFLGILGVMLSLYYGFFLIIPIPGYLPCDKTWSSEYKHKRYSLGGPCTYYRFRIPKSANDISKSVEEAVAGLGGWERTSTTTSDRILSEFRKSEGDILSLLAPGEVAERERYEVMRSSGALRPHAYRGADPFTLHTWFRHEGASTHWGIAVKVSSVGEEQCVLELWDNKHFDH